MNKHRIYFYGALARKGELPFGGGQVGNAKTLKLYSRLGIELRVIPKYFSPKNKCLLPFVVLANYFEYFVKLLFGKRGTSLVHIAGFYGVVMWHEWLLVATSKLLGFETVYEMRGGGAQNYYKDLGGIYRWAFCSTLKMSDYVFSQGRENIPLIRRCCNTLVYYHPNYVETVSLKKTREENVNDNIRLVYFGRLHEDKRIDLVVLTLNELITQGKNANLELIGAFESRKYETEISQLIKQNNLEDYITIVEQCEQEELYKRLQGKHFFLFPSETPREGQSNALTEAMAFGIVPISTDVGFSRSLVGDDELIFKAYVSQKVAEKVVDIVESKSWTRYSIYVSQRVREQFSENRQLIRLNEFLNQVWEE